MIGYVLLVVIAIGLSVAVFAYLKLYLPKDEPKCYDDVTLTIDEFTCQGGQVNITLTNRGLFEVDGAFIRIGEANRVVKTLLNNKSLNIGKGGAGLLPGKTWKSNYSYSGTGAQELELEPFIYIENKPVLCEKSVVSRRINCA